MVNLSLLYINVNTYFLLFFFKRQEEKEPVRGLVKDALTGDCSDLAILRTFRLFTWKMFGF